MAFPDTGFQFLRDRMGVTVECFASPLNCWNQRFCSVARDTDRFFGSAGNFFKFEGHTGRLTEDDEGLELGGSFEANPPFVEAVMNRMAERIDYLLEKYSDVPFSVVVVVPAWSDCEGVIRMTNSKFNRPYPGYRLVLEKNKHDYRPGMQHRAQHSHQPSNVDSFLFFLQNSKGILQNMLTLLFSVTYFVFNCVRRCKMAVLRVPRR
jgi:phosphorylated CTD-interacting factor 1